MVRNTRKIKTAINFQKFSTRNFPTHKPSNDWPISTSEALQAHCLTTVMSQCTDRQVVFNSDSYRRCSSNFFRWTYLNFFGLIPYAFNRSSDIVGSFASLFFFLFFFIFPALFCLLVLLTLSAAMVESCTLKRSFFCFFCVVTVHVSSAAVL